jgi:hypothetical protein
MNEKAIGQRNEVSFLILKLFTNSPTDRKATYCFTYYTYQQRDIRIAIMSPAVNSDAKTIDSQRLG